MEISVSAHPDAIRLNSDPMTIIRPEGDWDTPGILEQSAQRGGDVREVAA